MIQALTVTMIAFLLAGEGGPPQQNRGMLAPSRRTVIQLSGATQQSACNHDVLELVGNRGNISLSGVCERVLVRGNSNTIRIHAAQVIQIIGDQNRVVWTDFAGGKYPAIVAEGNRNDVSHAR